MRRLLIYAALAALLLAVSGCGQESAAAAAFGREDLYLQIDGAQYRCDTDIEAVVADLGAGYEYAEGMSCDYDGLDKTFAYEVAKFYTNPLAAGDMVNEIYTESAAVSTSRGIIVGASRQEVLGAYGEDCEDWGDLLIYSLPGERPSLCFELDGKGAVRAIYLTTQPV